MAHASTGTLALKVANTGFMLDRLGMDCDDLQFLRELTKNAIEAIQRTPTMAGDIVWDVDWEYFDATNGSCYRLCVTDNGVGMDGDEMVKYINHLSSSSGVQSHLANYGVGAKISAATRNPAGVQYFSWKDDAGAFIHLWKDPKTGEYGLHQLELPNGDYAHWGSVNEDFKPDLIKSHGTKVVLLGKSPEDNTMNAPSSAPSPSRWVTRYLNTRFFEFPKGISVKAREGWTFPRSDTDRNVLRTIHGQRAYLDAHGQSSGTVVLQAARAQWWILKDENALTQNTGYVASSGHCAALWQNELYEMSAGRQSTAMLQGFGVVFGYQRVVIYVEPTGDNVTTNTARTNLIINGKPAPWVEWQDEFRSMMPKEITAMMDEVASKTANTDHSESIKDRLKQIEDLFSLSRYRVTKQGPFLVDGETAALGGPLLEGSQKHEPKSHTGKGDATGTEAAQYALFLSEMGQPGQKAKPDVFPTIKWISIKDKTRAPGDVEDRAAKYLRKENLLLINADFRLFTDMVKRWTAQLAGTPGGVSTVVNEVVREWFEQSLVEVVLSANALRGSQHWTEDKIDELLSEEGFTAAVLPRYHIDYSIKRSLGSKLGAMKKVA